MINLYLVAINFIQNISNFFALFFFFKIISFIIKINYVLVVFLKYLTLKKQLLCVAHIVKNISLKRNIFIILFNFFLKSNFFSILKKNFIKILYLNLLFVEVPLFKQHPTLRAKPVFLKYSQKEKFEFFYIQNYGNVSSLQYDIRQLPLNKLKFYFFEFKLVLQQLKIY